MLVAREPGRWRRGFWLGLAVLTIAGPVVAAAYPSVLRIPRKQAARAPSVPPALFSHRAHGSLGCFTCHPSIFPQAPLGFTHEEMGQGQFCGHCHDGRVARPVARTPCGECHVPAR